MEREQGTASSCPNTPAPSNPGTSSTNCTSHANAIITTSRQQTLPQISVYGRLPDRQTVQVIQQALNRQPGTAAQYLQQMYAAQQQHLMLQTAALQQQHLSLAAVQQASIMAGRQSCSQNGTLSQSALPSQTTIKLASSPAAAAQLISRTQGANSSPVSITQHAVLLGNSSTPTITASQAQMYLRAQMLILTPTATVAAVQPEASSVNQQTTSAQMQNLLLHSQQGAVGSSSTYPHLQGLTVKQGAAHLALASQTGSQIKGSGAQAPQGLQIAGVNADTADASSETAKTNNGASETSAYGVNGMQNVTTVTSHPLINTAYTQIQTHQLLQQHKQQFVIHQQSQLSQRSQAQLFHPGSVQPGLQPQTQTVQTVAIQPALAAQQCGGVPVLPKPPAPCQQATIFHSTISPHGFGHNEQSCLLSPARDKQVQIPAVNVQLQPSPTQDGADKDNLAVREDCVVQSEQQLLSRPTQEPARTEQCLSEYCQLTRNSEEPGDTVCVNAIPGAVLPPAMTSGSGNNAPTVTGSTPQNGESKTPQAIVKPQILTHIIEGFVIQEGAEPFPVERPSLLIENLKKQKQHPSDLEKRAQDSQTADSEMEDLSQQELKNQEDESTLSCELCGKVDFAYNFKRSKRFCSTVCAKRYNVGCTKRIGLFPRRPTSENPKKQRASSNTYQSVESKKQNPSTLTGTVGSVSSPRLSHLSHGESSQCSDMSSYEEPPSPLSVASSGPQRQHRERGGSERVETPSRELPLLTQPFLPSDPAKWNVEDVYEFICSLPGCQEIAEEFRAQEIDGQALLLLKEDHLMSTMNIKLGPALKIFARISMLKDS